MPSESAARQIVPQFDLKRQSGELRLDLGRALRSVLDSSEFILGNRVRQFEREFARYCGSKHAIALDSGTGAIELSLQALDIKAGDTVFVPSLSFFSTASPALALGADVRFVDVETDTGLISCEHLEFLLRRRPRRRNSRAVIIPVHLYGQPADMDNLLALGDRFNATIIEDACQAHGAAIQARAGRTPRKAGAIGRIGCFSFYPTKNLGAFGDAGAAVTDDAAIARRLRLLRDYGRTAKYRHSSLGYNKRMDELQAAFLLVKLRGLDSRNHRRNEIAALYRAGIRSPSILPLAVRPRRSHVFHQYVVRCARRRALERHLDLQGIRTGIHYPIPLHLQPAFGALNYHKGDLPNSELLCREVLSLPIFPELSRAEISRVIKVANGFR